MHRERRDHLRALLGPDAVLVVPAAPVHIRNNDVEHDYRPDSDVAYLTGFPEPECVLVVPGDGPLESVLFVRARDPEREVWDGPRAGVEGAVSQFGVTEAHPIDTLDAKLAELFVGRRTVHYALGRDRSFDDRVLRAIAGARGKTRKGGVAPTRIIDTVETLHELRWTKSDAEIAEMRRAAEITRDGFSLAMDLARAGRFEHEVEAALRATFRAQGSERPAYAPIVASGSNACVLHYGTNNRRMTAGDLLLIDAGAEFGGYASDVTRTFPIDGTFTEPQREIYQLVLDAQQAAIETVKPGATIAQVHKRATEVVTEGLVKLGLLTGDVVSLLESQAFKKYFMHGTSHWLGMDVHDVGRYYDGADARPLVPGCVLTVEPGIYVPPGDESAPAKYRGIGVRIEDDVVVTPDGSRVLTHDIPKTVGELEAVLGARAPGATTRLPWASHHASA